MGEQCNCCTWVFASDGRLMPAFYSTEISVISSGDTVSITYIIMFHKTINVVLCSSNAIRLLDDKTTIQVFLSCTFGC